MFKFSKLFFFTGILFLIFVGAQHVVPLQRDVFAASASNAAVANAVATYSETTYFIHQDNLGSVVATTTEATGSATLQNSYNSYGSPNNETMEQFSNDQSVNKGITERTYTGQIADRATTLQYYNARYYDSTLSRFISSDQVQGGNRFAYVGGNPISNSDPTGNIKTDEGGPGINWAAIGGGISNPNTQSTAVSPGVSSTGVWGGTVGAGSQSDVYSSYGQTGWENDVNSIAMGGLYSAMQAPGMIGAPYVRDLDLMFNSPGGIAEKAFLAADMVMGGGLWGYGEYSMRNPNASFGDRFGQAIGPGLQITAMIAAPIMKGYGGVKNYLTPDNINIEMAQAGRPNYFAPEEYMTLYKGMRKYEPGTNILPGGEASVANEGYTAGVGSVQYEGQIGKARHSLLGLTHDSEYSSWSFDPRVAQEYAGSGGVVGVKKLSIYNSDYTIVQDLVSSGIDRASLAGSVGMSPENPAFVRSLMNNSGYAGNMQEVLLRGRVTWELLDAIYSVP